LQAFNQPDVHIKEYSMKIFRSIVKLMTVALLLGSISLDARDNGIVTISGTSSEGDKFTLVLTISDRKWAESEPNNASKVFNTKKGDWVLAPAGNVVNLLVKKGDPTTPGRLDGMVPTTVQSGATGNGRAFESGTTFNWTVSGVS
jgi:hypothetical protein